MVKVRGIRGFRDDEGGAVLVEALIVMNVVLLMLVAFIELTIAVNQWNMAVKSLQVGARIASVSDPVDTALLTLDQANPAGGINPGDPSLPFGQRICTSNGTSVACTGTNPAPTPNAAAFRRITGIEGGNCISREQAGTLRMCHVLPRLRPENLRITYTWGGLGYIDRPGGAVPVVTLTLRDVPFNFMLLGAFLGQNTITMPEFTLTAVAEDFMTTYAP